MTMLQRKGMTIQFLNDDITKVHAYAVVTGEDSRLAKESGITKSLLKHIPELRDERDQHKEMIQGKEGHRFGTVLLSDLRMSQFTGPMSFRYVLHAVLDSVRSSKNQWLMSMADTYREIFRKAETLRLSCLAVPLLGAGIADKNLAIKALTSAVNTCRTGYPTELLIVCNNKRILDDIQTELDSKRSEDKRKHQQLIKREEDLRKALALSQIESGKRNDTKNISATRSDDSVANISSYRGGCISSGRVNLGLPDIKCPNCPNHIQDSKQLDKCGHMFCRTSAVQSFPDHKPVWPSRYIQPDGQMDVGVVGEHRHGFETMRKRTGKLGSQGVLLSESRGTQKAQKRPPDLQRSQQETIHNKYIIELEKMGEVAKKKGFTLKKALLKKDIFTTLSEQLGHILREKIEEGNLRTVVADYLRRCQSTKDNSLEEFLIGTTLAEVLFSVERGDDVDGHVIISAVCNAMNVEVLLLASFGGEIQEVLFQPRREKEFLPTLIIGTISGNRLFRFELDNGPVPPDTPPTWSRSSKDPELVTLRSESAEFQEVKQSFLSSIGRSRTYIVIQIKRVQSTTQWVHFKVSLEQMAQKYPKMISERLLWHGTSATSKKSICKDGFNRSFCGKNATRYGEGTYFSRASSYAAEDTYSVPGWDGTKYMFRARVLTGLYTKGESDMKVPPYSNEAELTRFDSVVDNVDKPSLFVIFNDTKAYPEYLIKFRETVHKTVS